MSDKEKSLEGISTEELERELERRKEEELSEEQNLNEVMK